MSKFNEYEYILGHREEWQGRDIVIRTKSPFLVGRIILFDMDRLDDFLAFRESIKDTETMCAPIDDFAAYISADGCIVGGCDKDIASKYVKEMAKFVRKHVFVRRLGKYSEWCLNKDLLKAERAKMKEDNRQADFEAKMRAAHRKLYGD